MFVLPVAADLSRDAAARVALSALPDAPVVLETASSPRATRTTRARLRLSGALQRAAHAVAPPECSTAR